MSIEKALNFNDGYGNYKTDPNPTTYSDMHTFMENQNNVLLALASLIWQPSTAYAVGDVVWAPSMNGYHARCTKAGTSGTSVPTWKLGSSVTDGGVTWVTERQNDINTANTIKAGDKITIGPFVSGKSHGLRTAGILTGGSQMIMFTIPLNRPVTATRVSLSNGRMTIRQNNSYLFGSSSENTDIPSTATMNLLIESKTFISVFIKLAESIGGTNNAPIGVSFDGVLTFS